MEPYFLMMIIGGAVLVLFTVIGIVNFLQMIKGNELRKGIGTHLICGMFASLGGLSVGAGFIWFMVVIASRHG